MVLITFMKTSTTLVKGIALTVLALSIAVATPAFADNGNGQRGSEINANASTHMSFGQRFSNFFSHLFAQSNRDENATSTRVGTSTENDREGRGDKGQNKLDMVVSKVTSSSAKIIWESKASATNKVFYGISSPVATTSASSSVAVVQHGKRGSYTATITGLSMNTRYYVVVVSTEASGTVTTSKEISFVTRKGTRGGDETGSTTPPVISSILASSTASTTARITWVTNEPATSRVAYATSTPVGTAQVVSSATLVTNHEINLSGLVASSTYYFTVQSTDSEGNTSATYGNVFLNH